MFKRIYYGPPAFFIKHTNAEQRRALNFWLTVFWLTLGSILWWILKDALFFVGFMSLYAIWFTHWGAFSAETPVEQEDAGGET